MNSPPGTPLIAAHAALLAGKKKAIGWGASLRAPYLLAQSPYPFAFLVDSKAAHTSGLQLCGLPVLPPETLRQLSADEYSVVLLVDGERYGDEIRRQLAGIGPFELVEPMSRQSARMPSPAAVEAAADSPDESIEALCDKLRSERPRPVPDGHRKQIALFIGALSTGGAERQIVLLALGLRRCGHEVTLLTIHPDAPGTDQWSDALAAAGVRRLRADQSLGRRWAELRDENSLSTRIFRKYAAHTDVGHLHQLAFLTDALTELQPLLLVSYLDHANLAAGIAAVEAGVPRVLLSGRNQEPNCFPELQDFLVDKTRLPQLYRTLLALPGFFLSNNSRAGAASYAQWLELPLHGIPVIENAVEEIVQPPALLRERLGLPTSTRIVLGVMRLSEEKGPLRFVGIVAALLSRMPDVHAVLVGDGPLRETVRDMIGGCGLDGRLHMLGTRNDTLALMREADLLLHTSREEGMPNVLLEAQLAACPIVATDVGGVREALSDGWHPWLYSHRDERLAADLASRLLADQPRARYIAEAARKAMRGTRSTTRLAEATLQAAGFANPQSL